MTPGEILRAWFLASLAGGLWLGVLGRAAMVAIALAAGHPLRWSWGGSFEIVGFGLLLAGGITAAWMALRYWFPPLRVGRGLILGGGLLLVFALRPPPSAESAMAGIGQRTLSLLLFGSVLLGFGVLVERVLTRLAVAGPPPDRP